MATPKRQIAIDLLAALVVGLSMIAVLLALATAAGCSQAGVIRVDTPDGRTATVTQSGKAIAPATLSLGQDGTLTASTGNQQPQTTAMIATESASVLYWIGAILIVLGIGALVAKRWVPLIPTTAGTYLMLAGGACLFVPSMVGSVSMIPWWAYLIAAGIGLALVVPGWIANRKAAQAATESKP